MKTLLASALFLALGMTAHADTYQVSAYVDFVVNSQQYDFTYSYDVTAEPDGSATTSNVVYSVDNGSWTPFANINLGVALGDGSLEFASVQEGACVSNCTSADIFLDQEIYGPQGPTGQNVGFNWTVTDMPEPATYILLLSSIAGLIVFRRYVKTKVA